MQEPEIFEQPVAERSPNEDILYRGSPIDDDASADYHDFVFPEDRKLGTWSTAFLIINRVVGSGIYSTPSAIIHSINSVGITLIFWVIGGIMTFWYVTPEAPSNDREMVS
jgi:hypothetical protein